MRKKNNFKDIINCCSIILLMLVPILFAQNTVNFEMPTEEWFKLYSNNAKQVNLDRPEKGYSNRGFWIAKLAALSIQYIEEHLDTQPIYDELLPIALNDTYPYNRVLAIRGLALTQKRQAVESLNKILDDSCFIVSNEAAKAIVELGDIKNMKALNVLAKNASSNDIDKMSDEEFIKNGANPNVFRASKSKGFNAKKRTIKKLRKRAIVGLHKSKTEYSKKILKELEKDEDVEISSWAKGNGIKQEKE